MTNRNKMPKITGNLWVRHVIAGYGQHNLTQYLCTMVYTARVCSFFMHTVSFTDITTAHYGAILSGTYILTFRGPCIVIYSYNKTNEMHYFTNLFWCRTLHVSDRFTVHHQESSTVYTATGICHTGYADCLLA